MSTWRGVFRCDRLGVDDCVVWWDAVAAVGAWAAATITLFAVLVPLVLNLRKEGFRNRLALADYVHDLPEFISQWLEYGQAVESLLVDPSSAQPRDLARLTLDFPVPVLESSSRVERILVLLRLLKKDVKGWNRMVELTQRAAELHTKYHDQDAGEHRAGVDRIRTGLTVLTSMQLRIAVRIGELLDAIRDEVPDLRSTTSEMTSQLVPRS